MKFIQSDNIDQVIEEIDFDMYPIGFPVEGGYMMFESFEEYQTWENQK
jgi:hypothetical protein